MNRTSTRKELRTKAPPTDRRTDPVHDRVEPTGLVSNPAAGSDPLAGELALAGRYPSSLANMRLTLSERRVLLAVFDVLVLNAVLLAVLAVWHDWIAPSITIWQYAYYCVFLTLMWSIWSVFFDCYDPARAARASVSAWAAGCTALVTSLSYLAIPVLAPDLPTLRPVSALFVGLATAGVGLWRILYALILSQPVFQQRILVVGAGASGAEMARTMASRPAHGNPYAGSGYLMVGFVDDDPAKRNTSVEGMPVLGNCHDLRRLVARHQIDLLVIAIAHPSRINPELFRALLDCRERGVAIDAMTSLYERLTGRVLVDYAGRDLCEVLAVPGSPMHHLFSALKRTFDLIIGACGLMVLATIAPLIALGNACLCPGPLFYQQERVGKGGKIFTVHKFRSMIPCAEQEGQPVWAAKNDDRVTRIGRFLRRTRLDEFPQFWNVLKGDMSLIGPRPERPQFVARLVKEIPYYPARHAVRPGITGWAQVRYDYCDTDEDVLIKLQYDLYYIKRQSVYLELSIMAKTIAVMFGLKGR